MSKTVNLTFDIFYSVGSTIERNRFDSEIIVEFKELDQYWNEISGTRKKFVLYKDMDGIFSFVIELNPETTMVDVKINPIRYTISEDFKHSNERTIVVDDIEDGGHKKEEFHLVVEEEPQTPQRTIREPFQPSIKPDRKFGNDDVIIRWFDNRTMNIKYIEANTLNMTNEVGAYSVSKDNIVNDNEEVRNKSFIDKNLLKIEIDLIIGDCWFKDSELEYNRYMNRNEALKVLYNLYENNIVHSLESDLAVLHHCILEELSVEQNSESDNTYVVSCSFNEVDILKKLNKIHLVRDKDGEVFQEQPHEIPLPDYPSVYTDEIPEEEEEEGFWSKAGSWLKEQGKRIIDGRPNVRRGW